MEQYQQNAENQDPQDPSSKQTDQHKTPLQTLGYTENNIDALNLTCDEDFDPLFQENMDIEAFLSTLSDLAGTSENTSGAQKNNPPTNG